MNQTRQLQELESLNRAFQKAFDHMGRRENVEDLLSCLGGELPCGRISILEQGTDGKYDNTYEWCAPGVTPLRTLLHALPADGFSWMAESLREQEYLRVPGPAWTRPEAAELLSRLGARSLLASRLAFRGRELGFFWIESSESGILEDASILIPGIRYILSSLVYNERLVRYMEQADRLDHLTGMGSLEAMKSRLQGLRPGTSAGLCYVETAGWDQPPEETDGLAADQALIRTGEVLSGIFGEETVFRVASSEFLVLTDSSPIPFPKMIENLRAVLQESRLMCGIGSVWIESVESLDRLDRIIRRIHMEAHRETHRQAELSVHGGEPRGGAEDRTARITLPRSEAFFRGAEKALAHMGGGSVFMVVADLNYFKLYNDIFGREAGNLFLEKTAEAFADGAARLRGMAGYLGGDNFILLFPWAGRMEQTPADVVGELYRQLPYPDGFAPVLGVCLARSEDPLSATYDHALSALQEIKGSYVEHIRFYNPDHFMRARDDKLLLMEIREGLEKKEFTFFLQPQVREQTGKIVGAEALCRWHHKGQLINPGQFIPALEKTGMIFELDCMIWESVAAWIRSCADRGLPLLPVSVNVSRVDFFFTDIAEHFISLTRTHGIPPASLGIEITESAFADNTDIILTAVEKLHTAGFHILMDDFGSGYSSLSMLHTMNLDVLKTDVRFMSRQGSDRKAISIVESVVSMAHLIGMLVITEGIETESQRESLIAMGENYAQGFLFYQPMPPEQFEALIRLPENVGTPYFQSEIASRPTLHFREMVHTGLLSSSLLDNLIGPVAVLRLEGKQISMLQMNEPCRQLIGDGAEEIQGFLRRHESAFSVAFGKAAEKPGQGVPVPLAEFPDQRTVGRVFLLYHSEEQSIFFAALHPENG